MNGGISDDIKSIIYMKIGGKDRVGILWEQTTEVTNEIIKTIEKRIEEVWESNTNAYDPSEFYHKLKEILK